MSIIKETPSVIAVRTERRTAREALGPQPGKSQAARYRNTRDMLIVSTAWYQAWATQQRESKSETPTFLG